MKIDAMDTLTATNMLFDNSPVAQGFASPGLIGLSSQATQADGPLIKTDPGLGVLAANTSSSSTDEMMMDLFNGSDIDLLEGEFFL